MLPCFFLSRQQTITLNGFFNEPKTHSLARHRAVSAMDRIMP